MPNATGLELNFAEEALEKELPGARVLTPTDTGIGGLISGLMNAIMVIGVLMVLFFFVYGAVEWITSGGEKGKTESARNKMTHAVIGLIVLSATLAIFMLVQRFLGIEVVTVEEPSALERIGNGFRNFFRGLDRIVN